MAWSGVTTNKKDAIYFYRYYVIPTKILTLVKLVGIDHVRMGSPMKSISLSSLPNFHGITTEGPYAFLFKIDVLCESYDYTTDL